VSGAAQATEPPVGLLAEALPYLRAYRASLLESRGGAASEKEQMALRLTKLIDRAAAALAATGEPS